MNTLKKILQWILAAAMVLAGINHFLNTAFYLRMMPDYFYAPELLVYLSGVFEIALGILLVIPKFTRYAAFGLIALFIAVYPANFYMAQNADLFPEFSPFMLRLRLLLQFVLMLWAFWYTRKKT